MKKYQSHKVVEAGIIAALALDEDGSGLVIVEGVEYDVPPGFRRPGATVRPHAGDYFVRYQPDGYLSWSPRKAFEDGYKLVDQPAPSTTWQERARAEMDELAERADKLRAFLLKGGTGEPQADELMRQQYGLMSRYYDVLVARLRLVGVVDVETPPLVREERGTPAAVEVTVAAPAGKRADVSIGRPGGSTSWTVTEGQLKTWSVLVGEALVVCEGQPHSTVAHKRDAS